MKMKWQNLFHIGRNLDPQIIKEPLQIKDDTMLLWSKHRSPKDVSVWAGESSDHRGHLWIITSILVAVGISQYLWFSVSFYHETIECSITQIFLLWGFYLSCPYLKKCLEICNRPNKVLSRGHFMLPPPTNRWIISLQGRIIEKYNDETFCT